MKYKHALFLNPYTAQSSSTAMSFFPPTGLEYVATSAKDLVGKLTLLDMRYEKDLSDIGKLMDFIKKDVDLICVTIAWNRNFDQICDLLNQMPDGIPIVVGGYKATEKVEEIFERCPKVAIIVRGEGEETIRDVVKGMLPEDILGISYRKNGKVTHNKNRALPNVNAIKSPDRRLRRNKYQIMANGIKLTTSTFDTILSSRGCPFTCKFCTFSLNPLGQKRSYSPRSVESVIQEIRGISADIILFSDDNLFIDIKRAEELCDSIINLGIKKRFIAQARIDIARHPAILAKIVKAGFKMLLLGIESPHDYILTALDKGFDQATIRQYFKVFSRYPILYHGNYIYGNIGETKDEMFYISQFSREIGLDSVAFSKLRVDKYSPLKETVEKTPGYHLTERGELYSDVYSHSALKKIHRKMKFSFYTPGRLLKTAFKFVRVRFFIFSELMYFVAVSPLLLSGIIAREIKKNRLGDSLKRIFINNA